MASFSIFKIKKNQLMNEKYFIDLFFTKIKIKIKQNLTEMP